jgi:hypothetical protein
MTIKDKEEILKSPSDLVWVQIKSIEDLVNVGMEMRNALSYPPFAAMYADKMELYFLINPSDEKVLINASFNRDDGLPNMIAGPDNDSPTEEHKKDIDALLSFKGFEPERVIMHGSLFVELKKEDTFALTDDD